MECGREGLRKKENYDEMIIFGQEIFFISYKKVL